MAGIILSGAKCLVCGDTRETVRKPDLPAGRLCINLLAQDPTCGHPWFYLCCAHKDAVQACPVCGCTEFYT